MQTPIGGYLNEVLDSIREDTSGEVADYIPELAEADPNPLALALCTADGQIYTAGDADLEFSIQSVSKPFAYALALGDLGLEAVLEKVGVEPSGEAFNELSLDENGRPMNPMINAGAITIHSLIGGEDMGANKTIARLLEKFSALAGRELSINEQIYESEMKNAYRNLSIAYMLRNYGVIEKDPHKAVEGYVKQCSIMVNVKDLARMAATLGNGGVHPVTGKQFLTPEINRQVLSVMATCGMYNSAGDWLSVVGIPAKSGVAGSIMGALPGYVGVAAFSPRLDRHGNSVRGVEAFELMSKDMGMHLMESEPVGRSALRAVFERETKEGTTTVYRLQGLVQFAGAELVLRTLSDNNPTNKLITFDFTRVYSFNKVGRRMILEGIRRLMDEDYTVQILDPERTLKDPDLGDGRMPKVLKRLNLAS